MKTPSFFLSLAALVCALNVHAQDREALYEQAQSLIRRTEGKVFRDTVTPQWLPDNQSFWCRVSIGPDAQEFVLVDAATGTIRRAASAEELGLPEGVRVETLFTDCDLDELKIGMAVELVLRTLHQDEAGNDVETYMFRPTGQ